MPKVTYVSWIPFFEGAAIPPFGIFIEEAYKWDRDLYWHEIGHWLQYKDWGFWKFWWTVLSQYVRYGHDNAPLERDATKRGIKARLESK